jgi:hypothetical protein
LLYAGTERGVYVSFDDGAHWQPLQRNLPPVPIHDLAVKDNDLVAATHGRSFWILDDVSPLRQVTPAIAKAPAHLFKPADAYAVNWGGNFIGLGAAHPQGKNPPSGAIVYYTVSKPNQEVTLEFLDAQGKTIRTFSSKLDSIGLADSLHGDSVKHARADSLRQAGLSADSIAKLEKRVGGEEGESFDEEGPVRPPRPARVPNKVGLNQFAWDLRYPDASWVSNLIMWAGNTRGPIAPPGTYSVRMIVAGEPAQTQSFRLLKDPRIHATQAQLAEQFAFLIRIRDKLSAANDAVKTIRNVRAQVKQRSAHAPAGFDSAANAMLERIGGIEGEIYQVKNQSSQDPLNYPIRINNKLAALQSTVASAEGQPTAPSYAVFQELSAQLDKQLTALQSAFRADLPKLNAMLERAGQPAIVPKPVEIEAPKRLVGSD